MRFDQGFVVPASRQETWSALANMERVYGCMPGAQISEVAEDRASGILRMKIGPISAAYDGSARFESRDEDSGELIILAEGKDRQGKGTASARVRATVTELSATETQVEMENDLAISGRLAQFGRGVISDVSREMIDEFAKNLGAMIGDGPAEPQPGAKAESKPSSNGDAAKPPAPQTQQQPAVDMGAVALRIARRRAPELLLAGVCLVVVVVAIAVLAGWV